MLMSLAANAQNTFVDLGLPSGNLWATCNVGADSPEKTGDLFAWDSDQEAPSVEQWDELLCGEFTTNEVATLNGVKGVKVTGKNGNSIFLPEESYWTTDIFMIDGEDPDPSRTTVICSDPNNNDIFLYYEGYLHDECCCIRLVLVSGAQVTKHTISNIPDGWKVNGSTTNGTYEANEGAKVIFTPANIPAGKKIKSIKVVKQ